MDEETFEQPKTITDVIKALPPGAVQTWEDVTILVGGTAKSIYLFVVEVQNKNPLLQFTTPKLHLRMQGEIMMYHTGESVCHKKFFNRNFLPTFFIFDNYLHAYAFQQKLGSVGHAVQTQKFK